MVLKDMAANMATTVGIIILQVLLTVTGLYAASDNKEPTVEMSATQPALPAVNNSTSPPELAQPTTTKYPHEVCYEHVGCFNNSPPFDNANMVLPHSPDVVGTRFLLYTRNDPEENGTYFMDYRNRSSLGTSRYDQTLSTKIIIHGFSNSIKTVWLYEMKDALLKKEPMNVIIVLWGPGASLPDYPQAVANTRVVARQTAMLIRHMINIGAKSADVHLIGHSLGAHTSGYIGHVLRHEGHTIGRITGLDPAEPDYQNHPTVVRLDKADAEFVDVIHTNGAPFGQGGAGMIQPCGDVDFYVNGGKKQPDCPNQIYGALEHFSDLLSGNTDSIEDAISCSHSRSHDLFTESVNSQCPFTSYPCSSYSQFERGECLSCGAAGCGTLGYYANWYEARGKMYLNTRRGKPFCGHHYAINVKTAASQKDTEGRITVQLNGTWGVSEWINATKTDKDSLYHGSVHRSIGMAAEVVGDIHTVNVKYEKAHFQMLHWSSGQKTWTMDYITVVSGENGQKFTFCIDSPLKSGVPATGQRSKIGTC